MASVTSAGQEKVTASVLAHARDLAELRRSGKADDHTVMRVLEKLARLPMSLQVLKETRVGVEVNHRYLRQHPVEAVRTKSCELARRWKVLAGVVPAQGSGTGSELAKGSSGVATESNEMSPSTDPSRKPTSSQASYSPEEYFASLRTLDARHPAVPAETTKADPGMGSSVSVVPLSVALNISELTEPAESLVVRRAALRNGGQPALLHEVLCYLRAHGYKASMSELNSEIERIWGGEPRQRSHAGCSSWKMPPRGPGQAPIVGVKFVERHADQLRLKERKVRLRKQGGKPVLHKKGFDVIMVCRKNDGESLHLNAGVPQQQEPRHTPKKRSREERSRPRGPKRFKKT